MAVIFETEKVDFVFSSLKTAVTAKAKAAGVESADEEGAVGFENETRSFSCHLAKLNGAVVVSNSARQLERILAVEAGKVPALGETGEYRFFRHRYPIAAEESAYVFISDACLRSWAGPRVRIAASRRSRALAALGSLTSARISGEKLSQKYEPLPGKVRLFGDRVFSERYGSLGFLTPITELEIARVTSREKIQGPGGEEVEVLKIEREIIALTPGGLDRMLVVDWLAPGLGTVKSKETSKWYQSTMQLKKITKPE